MMSSSRDHRNEPGSLKEQQLFVLSEGRNPFVAAVTSKLLLSTERARIAFEISDKSRSCPAPQKLSHQGYGWSINVRS
jgi:hypothetical protein